MAQADFACANAFPATHENLARAKPARASQLSLENQGQAGRLSYFLDFQRQGQYVVAMPLSICLILVYATIIFAGGLIGYLKAGSKPSLIAGVVSAALLAGTAWFSWSNEVQALWIAGGIAALLSLVFLMRFLKTRSFMPSGMMLLVSLAATAYFALTAWRG